MFEDISAYVFENELLRLCKSLRNSNKSLEQLSRRIKEDLLYNYHYRGQCFDESVKILSSKVLKNQKVEIKRLQFKECEICKKKTKNLVMLENGFIINVIELTRAQEYLCDIFLTLLQILF